MDILSYIKIQIDSIDKITDEVNFFDVLIHLEWAEHLYEQGRKEKNENYYTDVIYRANQVYEGVIREAYKAFCEEPKSKINTYDIESYLTDNKIFEDRVVDHFRVYRKNWRNESTHDHRLFFRESEALMAIASVSSFTYILTNQVLQQIRFKSQKDKGQNNENIKQVLKRKTVDIEKTFRELIQSFVVSNRESLSHENIQGEEIISMLFGFIKSLNNDEFRAFRYRITDIDGAILVPDLMVKIKDVLSVIEFKFMRSSRDILHAATRCEKFGSGLRTWKWGVSKVDSSSRYSPLLTSSINQSMASQKSCLVA